MRSVSCGGGGGFGGGGCVDPTAARQPIDRATHGAAGSIEGPLRFDRSQSRSVRMEIEVNQRDCDGPAAGQRSMIEADDASGSEGFLCSSARVGVWACWCLSSHPAIAQDSLGTEEARLQASVPAQPRPCHVCTCYRSTWSHSAAGCLLNIPTNPTPGPPDTIYPTHRSDSRQKQAMLRRLGVGVVGASTKPLASSFQATTATTPTAIGAVRAFGHAHPHPKHKPIQAPHAPRVTQLLIDGKVRSVAHIPKRHKGRR